MLPAASAADIGSQHGFVVSGATSPGASIDVLIVAFVNGAPPVLVIQAL